MKEVELCTGGKITITSPTILGGEAVWQINFHGRVLTLHRSDMDDIVTALLDEGAVDNRAKRDS